jgi:hypothetical protein
MSLPPKLEREIEELQKGLTVEVHEDSSFANLVLKDFPLSGSFNMPSADLLIRVPLSYPDSGPDMFWTDLRVLLSDGREPQAANIKEKYLGREWRRFSWHRSRWDSVRDNLFTYLEFVRHRIAQKQ